MPRLCLVAGIHHGKQSLTRLGYTAEYLMEEFVTFCNRESPDVVIDPGDQISDVNHAVDFEPERQAAAFFSPTQAPVKHISGDHDRDHLGVEENEEIPGQSLRNEKVDFDDWQLVIFRADTFIHHPNDFIMPESDFLCLANTIAQRYRDICVTSL